MRLQGSSAASLGSPRPRWQRAPAIVEMRSTSAASVLRRSHDLSSHALLAGRERPTATLCHHIPNTGGQRGRLADLAARPTARPPASGHRRGGAGAGERKQIVMASTPLVSGRSPTSVRRGLTGTSSVPPPMSSDVVDSPVGPGPTRASLDHNLLDRVERIATRQATNGAKTMVGWKIRSPGPSIVDSDITDSVESKDQTRHT